VTLDSIVQRVIKKHEERAEKGMAKYGVNLDRQDLTFSEWVNHLQEELMDATLYAEKLKQEGHSEIINVMIQIMYLMIPPKHVDAFTDWLNHPINNVEFKGEKPIDGLKRGDVSKVKHMLDDINYGVN
jgi:hypothetical protein